MQSAETQLRQTETGAYSRVAFSTRTVDPLTGVEYLDQDYVASPLAAKVRLMGIGWFSPNTYVDCISFQEGGCIVQIKGPVSPDALLNHLGPLLDLSATQDVEIITS